MKQTREQLIKKLYEKLKSYVYYHSDKIIEEEDVWSELACDNSKRIKISFNIPHNDLRNLVGFCLKNNLLIQFYKGEILICVYYDWEEKK